MITEPVQLLIGLIFTILSGFFAFKQKIVDNTGFLAGVIVGITVLVFGGWEWLILILVFLFVAGQSTKYRYEQKKMRGIAEEKGGVRSWRNVLANGGLAALLAVAETLFPQDVFFFGFLGAISTSTADTLATEIGILHLYEPRLITSLKKRVPTGTSGGVSSLGEFASLVGAFTIGLAAWIIGGKRWSFVGILMLSVVTGFLGNNFDSFLGATIQATYKCSLCGKIIEKRKHCGNTSILVKGNSAITNNTVNLLSTIFGSILAILLFLYTPLVQG